MFYSLNLFWVHFVVKYFSEYNKNQKSESRKNGYYQFCALSFEPVVSLRVDRLSAMSYISPCWTPPSRRYPVGQQETIAFKVLIGYKKPPPKWKKPFNGIPVEALSKEN